MLEKSQPVARQLQENVTLLGLEQVRVEQTDALSRLQGPGEPFDIVFLDPPFADGLLQQACRLLQDNGWLKPDARIYLETDLAQGLPELPAEWRLLKQKKAGQVAYFLAAAN